MLRSDDREKWEKLDQAIAKKIGNKKFGITDREGFEKAVKILALRVGNIRGKLIEEITPSIEILKSAASSAVKPFESGKKLKNKIKDLNKKEDTRTIRERLAQKAKEEVERENGVTEDEEVPTDAPVEETPEVTPEVADPEAVDPTQVDPMLEAEGAVPAVEDDMAGEQAASEDAPPAPGTPEEQAMEAAQVEQLPENVDQLDPEGMPEEGMPEEAVPGEEVPEDGMVPQDQMLADPTMAGEMAGEDMMADPQEQAMQPGMENMQVATPDPTMAQANDGVEQEKLLAMQDELERLHQSLQEIQAMSEEQGLLTTEELENIIIPLLDETEMLMELMQSQNEYRQQPEQEYGPPNQVGDISRELGAQSNNFQYSKSTGNLSKNTIETLRDGVSKNVKKLNKSDFYKEEGKGWHGDPHGHAEAARARWEGTAGTSTATRSAESEGPATKPKKNPVTQAGKKVVEIGGEVVREMGRDTARAFRRAGRGIADTVGDTIADYGGEAVVAGMTAYLVSTLKGDKRSLKDYLGDMKTETLSRIQEVKDWKVIRRLSRSNEVKVLGQLANRAKTVAGKAGSTKVGQLSGRALRFAGAAAKNNPRVAAALFLASALGAEGAKRAGAKIKEEKKSKAQSKKTTKK